MASEGPAESAAPASLIVVDPNGHRTRVEIQPIPFKIGRQADNHLILRDSRASRNHAQIVLVNGEYAVEDLRQPPWGVRQWRARRAAASAQL